MGNFHTITMEAIFQPCFSPAPQLLMGGGMKWRQRFTRHRQANGESMDHSLTQGPCSTKSFESREKNLW